MPDCEYFEKGICFKDNCFYRHVKFNDDAKICDDFTKGYCALGINCNFRHVILGGLNAKEKMIGDNTNRTKTKKKINGDSPEELPKIIVTDSVSSVESSEIAGALIDSSCEATDTNISTILVETDLFIPFSSVATSSATGMKRGVDREDRINLVDDDIEECAEHSEICEEVCEEDNAEKIDGEQEHGEEEEGGEEEEEVVSGVREEVHIIQKVFFTKNYKIVYGILTEKSRS